MSGRPAKVTRVDMNPYVPSTARPDSDVPCPA